MQKQILIGFFNHIPRSLAAHVHDDVKEQICDALFFRIWDPAWAAIHVPVLPIPPWQWTEDSLSGKVTGHSLLNIH